MKYPAVAVLAACAAALTASCASAPRTAPPANQPLTIEMFDSRAAVAAAAVPALPVRFRLLLPEVPSMETPPAVSRPAPGPDASLRNPGRPSLKATFRLDSPEVPAPIISSVPDQGRPDTATAQSSRTIAPGPAPTSTSTPKLPAAGRAPAGPPGKSTAASTPTLPGSASPAPALPRSSAAAPSAPGPSATGPSAAGPSATAPSTSAGRAGSAGAAAPYGRLREIYARQGDELQIGLDGVGFLFLGLPDAQVDGMSFKSKETRANKTLFTFQAQKLGTYDLDFLQQDNMAGKTSRETVRVHVVSEEDFAAATAEQSAADASSAIPAASSQESGDPAFAQRLAAAGSYTAAVAELLKGYREGNPSLNDQIAALYLKMGSYDAAGKYWSRNLAPQTDFTPRAVVGLFRVSVLQNDQQALLSYLRPFLALNDPAMEEPLILAVRMEKGRAEIGIALDLAAEYVRRYPDGTWRDEADFLSAQLLEADSQFRDISRARQLYLAIVSEHPESPYADIARLRVQYIDRHFLQVR